MISYTIDKPPTVEAVQRLLQQTDWARNRDIPTLEKMLSGSINACAWDGETLVGYARAVSDGCCRAFIEDVVVDESYRKQGIGGGVVQALLQYLNPIEQIVLNCSDDNVPFYKKYGFKIWDSDNRMHIWKGN